MTLYRELPLLSKLLILTGGFNLQFGLIFMNAGLLFVNIFLMSLVNEGTDALAAIIGPSIFVLTGLIFVVIGLNKNMKALQLLQYGILTSGKLNKTEYTNVKVNNIPEIKFTYEFNVNGKKHLVTGRTHEHHLVEDPKNERIIYNPDNPDFAILYDLIPNAPKLNQDQTLQPVDAFKIYLLIQPIIAIVLIFWLFRII
ncbi:MAG: hypothetical protein K1X92_17630 [Bacteroidia bacterium]|nr:hypothetical protein [Bacteroidia bacterium]